MDKKNPKQHTTPYYLDVKFGEKKAQSTKEDLRPNFQINAIEDLYIILDINRLLPSFRFKFHDPERIYSHLLPFDSKWNKIRIGVNRNARAEEATFFDFDIYRRFPTSDFICDIEGLLRIDGLFSPERIRAFSTSRTMSTRGNLASIALKDLGVDDTDISISLASCFRSILQPGWTNAELLNYLKTNLVGGDGEAGFFCFIRCQGTKKVFVFKTVREFYSANPKYFFADSIHAFSDSKTKEIYYPILDFKIYDNYKILGVMGTKRQDLTYFDYDNSGYKELSIFAKGNTDETDDFFSLTKRFSINSDDSEDNLTTFATGRSNDFTSNFKERAKDKLFKRLNNLSKFWITTWGLEDIYPGDIVVVKFVSSPITMMSNQYNGFWMVERVVHLLGNNFGTRLLLTRSGVNTIEDTLLLEVDDKNIKRV